MLSALSVFGASFACREQEPAGEKERCEMAASHSSTILDHVQRQLQAELKAREADLKQRWEEEAAGSGAEAVAEAQSADGCGVTTKEGRASWADSELWRRLKAGFKTGESARNRAQSHS